MITNQPCKTSFSLVLQISYSYIMQVAYDLAIDLIHLASYACNFTETCSNTVPLVLGVCTNRG